MTAAGKVNKVAPPGRVSAKSKDAIGRELDIARARKEFFLQV